MILISWRLGTDLCVILKLKNIITLQEDVVRVNVGTWMVLSMRNKVNLKNNHNYTKAGTWAIIWYKYDNK